MLSEQQISEFAEAAQVLIAEARNQMDLADSLVEVCQAATRGYAISDQNLGALTAYFEESARAALSGDELPAFNSTS